MKLKSVLSVAVALIVAVVVVPFVWNVVQQKEKKGNDKLISNWKVCNVHTDSIESNAGGLSRADAARIKWLEEHRIDLPGIDGHGAPNGGMTDEDLRTCLLMREDEVK